LKAFHVALDLLNGGELVAGFGELEGVFKFSLPVAIRREGKAFGEKTSQTEFSQQSLTAMLSVLMLKGL